MQKMPHFQPSPAYSIRSSLVCGLALCAMARAESRMGSLSRLQQLLSRAKHVVETTLRSLHEEEGLSNSDRRHLCKLLDQLQVSIGGLDPLWVPKAGAVPADKVLDSVVA